MLFTFFALSADMQALVMLASMPCARQGVKSTLESSSFLLVPLKLGDGSALQKQVTGQMVLLSVFVGLHGVVLVLAFALKLGKKKGEDYDPQQRHARAAAAVLFPSASLRAAVFLMPGAVLSAVAALATGGESVEAKGLSGALLLWMGAVVVYMHWASTKVAPCADYDPAVDRDPPEHDCSWLDYTFVPLEKVKSRVVRAILLPTGFWCGTAARSHGGSFKTFTPECSFWGPMLTVARIIAHAAIAAIPVRPSLCKAQLGTTHKAPRCDTHTHTHTHTRQDSMVLSR